MEKTKFGHRPMATLEKHDIRDYVLHAETDEIRAALRKIFIGAVLGLAVGAGAVVLRGVISGEPSPDARVPIFPTNTVK